MGQFTIEKLSGGLGRRLPGVFMTSGMIFGGVATPSLNLGDVSPELRSAADAEAIGIDANYDDANNILVYHHIKEFFRLNPSAKLFIMLVAQGTTLQQMFNVDANAKKLINDADGNIRQLGAVLNPDMSSYSPTLSGGLDQDVINAIADAQTLATWAFENKKPCLMLIEGREFNGTVASADDLRTKEAPDVCVTIGQDPAVAALKAEYVDYANVGTTLGAISLANPGENIGWTSKFNLFENDSGAYASAGLSSNDPSINFEADWATLTSKGFIFIRTYPQQQGVYFDDFPTCTSATSDYAYGENTRVINEASRLLYDALFPRVNGPIKINPDNGQIDPEVAAAFEADGFQSLSTLVERNDISARDVYVDPNQDVQATGIIEVQFSIVSIATGREIKAKIGFVKNI